MRVVGVLAVVATLAGCAAPGEVTDATVKEPWRAPPPGWCPALEAALVRLNVTGLAGAVTEAWLEAAPLPVEAHCEAASTTFRLAPGAAMLVPQRRYVELRAVSATAIGRVALDLTIESPGTLEVLLAPAAAAAWFEGQRVPVERAEVLDDPRALDPRSDRLSVPLSEARTAMMTLPVSTGWNEGFELRSSIVRPVGPPPDARAQIRVYAPNGTLAAERDVSAAATIAFVVPADAPGDWRVHFETFPSAGAVEGRFDVSVIVRY